MLFNQAEFDIVLKGKKQFDWLKTELIEAKENRRNVFVFAHIPMCPQATSERHLLWNNDEVMHCE